MNSRTLKIAGSLAMASAFLSLPLVYLSFTLEGRTDAYANGIQTFIQAAGTLIFIAIVSYLKRLLNSRFAFHATNKSIELMIMASMVTGMLTIGMFSFPTLKESLSSAVIVILVLLGIVQAQFGFKLLALPNDLGGMHKPFCYANMVTGIALASVVLIPVSILTSAISDLMLGTIFFNMAKLAKEEKH